MQGWGEGGVAAWTAWDRRSRKDRDEDRGLGRNRAMVLGAISLGSIVLCCMLSLFSYVFI